MYIYLFHRHVFRPSQDSSVWLGLTSREKLTAPQCSMKKFRAYILYMYMYVYIYIYIYIFILNKSGPSIDPCATPAIMLHLF